MRSLAQIRRPPWRTIVPAVLFVVVVGLGYIVWTPGAEVNNGRHDRRRNGIWLQHGWLGHDNWFIQNQKTDRLQHFRDPAEIEKLVALLRQHHITDLFPHLSPTHSLGQLPPVDDEQVTRFLDGLGPDFRVLPWTGGVLDDSARTNDPQWRATFVRSVRALLDRHPRLAGIHINVEPCPTGDKSFLMLLEELRASLPSGKLLSIAAYPPPTRWHPYDDIHWDKTYFRQVADRSDQIVVMMYDTGIHLGKLYENLMRQWTSECLDWSGGRPVLLGVPAYDDAGVGYHHPRVENVRHALRGIHAGLLRFDPLPSHYQGLAIYSEWEMDQAEWETWREKFMEANETR
jgi:hypothetical protein